MRRIARAVSAVLLTLLGCLGADAPGSPSEGPVTSLWKTGPVILLDSEQGLLAVNPDDGEIIRWAPTPTTDPSIVLAQPHVLFAGQLLGLSGQSYPLPLPEQGFGAALSPDQRTLAYALAGAQGSSTVRLVELDGTGDRPLTDQGAEPTWLPGGAIGLRDGDTLGGTHVVRVRPDGADLQVLVDTGGQRGRALSFSPDGQTVALASGEAVLTSDGQGVSAFYASPPGGQVWHPSFSPDGRQLALLARAPDRGELREPTNLYVGALGSTPRAILSLAAKKAGFLPWGGAYAGVRAYAWSPDGQRFAFVAAMSGDCRKQGNGELICKHDLYVVGADGQGMKKVARLGLTRVPNLRWAR